MTIFKYGIEVFHRDDRMSHGLFIAENIFRNRLWSLGVHIERTFKFGYDSFYYDGIYHSFHVGFICIDWE